MSYSLSVVVTFYNNEHYVKKILKNINKQKNQLIEILVFNDGSFDNTNRIIQKYKKNNNFFRYIFHKKNKGIAKIRNEAIKIAKGEFIFFIDGDDNIKKNSFKICLNNILKYPQTEIFFLNYVHNDGHRKKKILRFNTRELFSSTTVWQYIFSIKFLNQNKIKFLNLKTHEDWLFTINCILASKKRKLINIPFYIWNNFNINSLGKDIGLNSIKAWIETVFRLNKIKKNKKRPPQFILYYINKFILESVKKIKEEINILSDHEIYVTKKLIRNKFLIQENLSPRDIDIHIDKSRLFFNLLAKKLLGFQNLSIFCAGTLARVVIFNLLKNNLKIDYIFDNNKFYNNQKIYNIKIAHPKLKKINLKSFNFIICNIYKNDTEKIIRQLLRNGVKKTQVFSIKTIN